ncbi:putative indole-3-pyruvate monooxygenase YUCCA11 [Bidens hawaiensis]|uniref:putative indole-3-pyruvate monooxygenase YUCCA11 n=1 Tax=Bidens hawaiensis TaxID=980011 RepID=UPI00404A1E15
MMPLSLQLALKAPRKWLKDDGGLFNEKGMPKHKSPNNWKGEYGLYCVGFASAGLFDNFNGLVIHSSEYEIGKKFGDEKVLVVGVGNSGMEIAYDLCNWGAQISIVICSPVMPAIKDIKDDQIKFTNGQEKQYDAIVFATGFKSTVRKWLKDDRGLFNEKGMPKHKSPNHWKGEYGLYCVGFASAGLLDTCAYQGVSATRNEKQFDAIVFATGFKSTVRKWLKDDGGLFNEKGMPKHKSPNHWKGEYGLYCVGFASAGLFGISNDAKNIANDISRLVRGTN